MQKQIIVIYNFNMKITELLNEAENIKLVADELKSGIKTAEEKVYLN